MNTADQAQQAADKVYAYVNEPTQTGSIEADIRSAVRHAIIVGKHYAQDLAANLGDLSTDHAAADMAAEIAAVATGNRLTKREIKQAAVIEANLHEGGR